VKLKAHLLVLEEKVFKTYKKKWPYEVSKKVREAMREYLEKSEGK